MNEAVVTLYRAVGREPQLAAYYVGAETHTTASLRAALASGLPSYMLPDYFVRIPALPLTRNGKCDVRALPEPRAALELAGVVEEPHDEMQRRLVEIWRTALGVKNVGIKDSFFNLGGFSMSAMEVLNEVERQFGVKPSFLELLDHPTIEAFSRMLAGKETRRADAIPRAAPSRFYPASSAQRRIFTLHQLDPSSVAYNMPAALILRGKLDVARLERALQAVVARHEILRTRFDVVDGEVVQEVLPELVVTLACERRSGATLADVRRGFVRPFELHPAAAVSREAGPGRGRAAFLLSDWPISLRRSVAGVSSTTGGGYAGGGGRAGLIRDWDVARAMS